MHHEFDEISSSTTSDASLSSATFYNWRSKHAGLDVNDAKRLRELESENKNSKALGKQVAGS
ncbi:transposase [Pseudomonas sp. gcc21]|nr:transposase [Pseudomonas sp. gcc21]